MDVTGISFASSIPQKDEGVAWKRLVKWRKQKNIVRKNGLLVNTFSSDLLAGIIIGTLALLITHVDAADQDVHRCGATGDGIAVNSCTDVKIKNCSITTGDDAICLKSFAPSPCEDESFAHRATRVIASCISLALPRSRSKGRSSGLGIFGGSRYSSECFSFASRNASNWR